MICILKPLLLFLFVNYVGGVLSKKDNRCVMTELKNHINNLKYEQNGMIEFSIYIKIEKPYTYIN